KVVLRRFWDLDSLEGRSAVGRSQKRRRKLIRSAEPAGQVESRPIARRRIDGQRLKVGGQRGAHRSPGAAVISRAKHLRARARVPGSMGGARHDRVRVAAIEGEVDDAVVGELGWLRE